MQDMNPSTGKSGSIGAAARVGVTADTGSNEALWTRVVARLRTKVGEDVYISWFGRLEFVTTANGTMHMTVPTHFLRKWLCGHYKETLLECVSAEFDGVTDIDITVRQPGAVGQKPITDEAAEPVADAPQSFVRPIGNALRRIEGATVGTGGTDGGGFDGSPLDMKYTFDSFVVGGSNRLAHAAAKQIAETALNQPLRFNPLYIHSNVGLGKTHLLHAIAWEVKRKWPNAQVLYLTSERFRARFVEVVRNKDFKDAMSFKERLRNIDILCIDDMEFLKGGATEQEFDHTLNALLDGGKQVVVAGARAPLQLDALDSRTRSRLAGGLVTEITSFDYDLRLKVLERRMEEKRIKYPNFHLERHVLEFLAERITESGRELDGAVTKLLAKWQLEGQAVTLELAEDTIRDLLRSQEPRRIKVEDILKVVAKHYGVTRGDMVSERRHRSIVWPRQIGMWLAKTMTSRSLPEIGRRFGGRDHTTVLHAIRKIEGELQGNSRLRAEIEDLKRMLSSNSF